MNETENTEEKIYLEAAEWIERMANQPLDNLNEHRFSKWLQQHPRNRSVFEAMLETWRSDALNEGLARKDRQQKKQLEFQPFRYAPLAFACVVFLAVLITGTFFWRNEHTVPSSDATVATSYSEQRTLHLGDGSTLSVGPSSRLQIHLSADSRTIELESGVTHFEVAKDNQRPFKVQFGDASVVAVGTVFNIDRGQNRVDVIVHEGAVEVSAGAHSPPVLVKASEQIHIHHHTLGEVTPVDLTQYLDWRSGWVELNNQPLIHLIERLNRRRAIPIVLANAQLGELPIAGRFRLKDSDYVLAMLEEIYPLSIVSNDGVVEIRPAP